MTNERAKSELEQLYMMLSEEKKKALDVAFKAMEQADNIPVMYYPQVDGITPTVVAQADGEKTCGTCRNEDTYHCAECENKSDYEQAQADGEYIKKSDMIDWLKDIRHRMKPQNYHTASEFEIAENQIWNLIQMLQMGAFPSVAIPSAEPCEDAISRQAVLEMAYDMSEIDGEHFTEPCMVVDVDDIQKLPSVNPQDCDTCEVGNPCLYCKHEFEPQESEV